jgi:hypothetical protein
MSSLVRTIQRTVRVDRFEQTVKSARAHFDGRGSKLGVNNPRDKSKLARLARDKKWGRK